MGKSSELFGTMWGLIRLKIAANRKRSVFVIGMGVVMLTIAVTIFLHKTHDSKNGEVAGVSTRRVLGAGQNETASDVELRGQPLVSEAAEISFDYPSDWTIHELSQSGGKYQWRLDHIENKPIMEALEQKYGVSSTGAGAASVVQLALLNDPLVEKLTTTTITVYKAPQFRIENSLAEWRTQTAQNNKEMGYWSEQFEDIQVGGLSGYAYTSRIAIGKLNLSTTNYMLLSASDRRIEISVFPSESPHTLQIEAIVASLKVLE